MGHLIGVLFELLLAFPCQGIVLFVGIFLVLSGSNSHFHNFVQVFGISNDIKPYLIFWGVVVIIASFLMSYVNFLHAPPINYILKLIKKEDAKLLYLREQEDESKKRSQDYTDQINTANETLAGIKRELIKSSKLLLDTNSKVKTATAKLASIQSQVESATADLDRINRERSVGYAWRKDPDGNAILVANDDATITESLPGAADCPQIGSLFLQLIPNNQRSSAAFFVMGTDNRIAKCQLNGVGWVLERITRRTEAHVFYRSPSVCQ